MKLHRYVDHQRLHIVTKDVISLSISVLLLFRHYISHKITFGAPSSGGVLRSACGAFILILIFIPPANFVCGGYTVFTLSVRVCVRASIRPSVTFCFFNILKNHCWIFIKPCKHVHICKTNTLDKKVRARG